MDNLTHYSVPLAADWAAYQYPRDGKTIYYKIGPGRAEIVKQFKVAMCYISTSL